MLLPGVDVLSEKINPVWLFKRLYKNFTDFRFVRREKISLGYFNFQCLLFCICFVFYLLSRSLFPWIYVALPVTSVYICSIIMPFRIISAFTIESRSNLNRLFNCNFICRILARASVIIKGSSTVLPSPHREIRSKHVNLTMLSTFQNMNLA